MNREAAKQLVRECWEDARALKEPVFVEEQFRALVAARLAPETKPVVEFAAAFGAAPDLPEPRPSYVPEGAPWEWTVLASGERVAMWKFRDTGMLTVVLHDPRPRQPPWQFRKPDTWDSYLIGTDALAAVASFGRKHGVWE